MKIRFRIKGSGIFKVWQQMEIGDNFEIDNIPNEIISKTNNVLGISHERDISTIEWELVDIKIHKAA